ncbi:MAG: spore coat polysaccharide biosynthesis protein SpsF [Chlamydiales bacterium]|jgi:spore coat polysaccharide biosynthesis protein SpsF
MKFFDKTVAFIPVRLTSSRLQAKHFKLIGGRYLLSWVIQAIRSAKEVDEIVICTLDTPENHEISLIAHQEKVDVFFYNGEEEDVVGRMTAAARLFSAEICVLASGDVPLMPSDSIDRLVTLLKENPKAGRADFSPCEGKELLHEAFVVARRKLWEKADELSDTPELREHQFPILYSNPEKFPDFPLIRMQDDPLYYTLLPRMSIDTLLDLKFANRIYSLLKESGLTYTYHNAVHFLNRHPEALEINRHVKQREVKEKILNVVFVVERAEDKICIEELSEIHQAFICYFGAKTVFVSRNEKICERLSQHGFSSRKIDSDYNELLDLKKDFPFQILVMDVDSISQSNTNLLMEIKKNIGVTTLLSRSSAAEFEEYVDYVISPVEEVIRDIGIKAERSGIYLKGRASIKKNIPLSTLLGRVLK